MASYNLGEKTQTSKNEELKNETRAGATFSDSDIKELQQIHFKETGELLSTQETIEMGIRIKELLRIVARPL